MINNILIFLKSFLKKKWAIYSLFFLSSCASTSQITEPRFNDDYSRLLELSGYFTEVMYHRGNEVWEGFSWENEQVLLVDPETEVAILWNDQSKNENFPVITKLDYNSLDPYTQYALYNFLEFQGYDTLTVSLLGYPAFSTTEKFFGLAVHESFHFIMQDVMATEGGNRSYQYPQPSQAQYYRMKTSLSMLEAFESPENKTELLGNAKFWYEKYKNEYPQLAEDIIPFDYVEGSALYVELRATAILRGWDGEDLNSYKNIMVGLANESIYPMQDMGMMEEMNEVEMQEPPEDLPIISADLMEEFEAISNAQIALDMKNYPTVSSVTGIYVPGMLASVHMDLMEIEWKEEFGTVSGQETLFNIVEAVPENEDAELLNDLTNYYNIWDESYESYIEAYQQDKNNNTTYIRFNALTGSFEPQRGFLTFNDNGVSVDIICRFLGGVEIGGELIQLEAMYLIIDNDGFVLALPNEDIISETEDELTFTINGVEVTSSYTRGTINTGIEYLNLKIE